MSAADYQPWHHADKPAADQRRWGLAQCAAIWNGEYDGPKPPDLALHVSPDPESLPDTAPTVSRSHARRQEHFRTRIDADGWGNDGRFHGREGEVA